MLDSTALATISASVVALCQLMKGVRVPKRYGLALVFGVSALGVLLYAFSQIEDPWAREQVWPLFAAWVVVSTSASGAYGLVRDAVGTVSKPHTAERDTIQGMS